MHTYKLFFTLLFFTHMTIPSDVSLEEAIIIGGIERIQDESSAESVLKKHQSKKRVITLSEMLRSAPLPMIAKTSEFISLLNNQLTDVNQLNEKVNEYTRLYNENLTDDNLLRKNQAEGEADKALAALKSSCKSYVMRDIPLAGIKGIAGDLGGQMLSKNIYQQIVYKHFIWASIDATLHRDNKSYENASQQFLKGVVIEAASCAITEYLFKQMKKNRCDPTSLLRKQWGPSPFIDGIDPYITNMSKICFYSFLVSKLVTSSYDKAISTTTDHVASRAILGISFNFGSF